MLDHHRPETLGRELRGHHEAAAVRERCQHRHGERVDVIQRQHGRHAVIRDEQVFLADRLRIGGEVRLCQQHALGLSGRARRVHQQCRLVWGRRSTLDCSARQRIVIRVDDDDVERSRDRGRHRAHALGPLGRDEDQLRVGMIEHEAHLLGLREQVDRIDAVPAVHRAEQQAYSLRAVAHHHRYVRTRTDPPLVEPAVHRAARIGELAKADQSATLRRDEVNGIGRAFGAGVDQFTDRPHRVFSRDRGARSTRRALRLRSARTSGIVIDTRVMFR